MSKKRSKTSDFSLELNTKKGGKLPTPEEVEKTIAKATGKEKKEALISKPKRIPFTTAITPEQRAILEALALEGKESIADIVGLALEHYFSEVRTLENEEMKTVFLKIFEKKLK